MGGNQDHNLIFWVFSANADTSFTAQMTLVTANGFVGIGTYPSDPLQVNGGQMVGYTNVYVRTGWYEGSDYNISSLQSVYFTAAFDCSIYVGGLIIIQVISE